MGVSNIFWIKSITEVLRVHIPDGYLDAWVLVFFFILTAIMLILAFKKANKIVEDRHIPLFAVLTAAVFAAQMINWPVGPGGTTAHLVGGALIAIFLGAYGGLIAMAVILLIQAFLFGDGGITALGANIWNMGVVECFVGYYLYRAISKALGDTPRGKVIGAFFGGWIGITLAAFFCGLEIGISTIFPYDIAVSVPVMTIYHGLLGTIEGFITAFVVGYTIKVKPDLLELPKINPP